MFDEENKTKSCKKVKSHKKNHFGHFTKSNPASEDEEMANCRSSIDFSSAYTDPTSVLNQYSIFTQR